MHGKTVLESLAYTTVAHTTYEPFLAAHGDGTDPWFVRFANELVVMNKQNRHRILFITHLLSYMVIIGLVSLAGIASGLTLALFTLDPARLNTLVAAGGRSRKAEQARRVLPFLANPHWSLVTLLVVNAFAAETMPLVLNRMYGGAVAIVLSVFLILFFGEIIPQAFFARYALPICSFFAPFLGFMRVLTAPISWPIGKLLDMLVGHRQKRFMRRMELQQLIRLHQNEEKHKRLEERDAALIDHAICHMVPGGLVSEDNLQQTLRVTKRGKRRVQPGPRPMMHSGSSPNDDSDGGSDSSSDSEHLEELEVRIMIGALSMSELKVKQIIKKPLDKIFCIAADRKIDKEVVDTVFLSGFSRVLVFDEDKKRFIGYFLSRDLVAFAYKSQDSAPLARNLHLHEPIYVSGEETVGTLYTTLCMVSTPIVIVTADTNSPIHEPRDTDGKSPIDNGGKGQVPTRRPPPIGLVTFEDVFETVQGTSIFDETDNDSDKAIQLKSKLFKAMVTRRQNLRLSEAITKGMLKHELTEDLFMSPGYDNNNSLLGGTIGEGTLPRLRSQPQLFDLESGGGGLTSRTGLLGKNDSFVVTTYGATNVGRRAAAAGLSLPANTLQVPVPSDTFLSPRLRALHTPAYPPGSHSSDK